GSAWTTVHRGERTDPGDFWPSSAARAELAARASAAPALTYCRFAIADCGWAVVARINPQSEIRNPQFLISRPDASIGESSPPRARTRRRVRPPATGWASGPSRRPDPRPR